MACKILRLSNNFALIAIYYANFDFLTESAPAMKLKLIIASSYTYYHHGKHKQYYACHAATA